MEETKHAYDCFRWSEMEYPVREFLDRFGHQLPYMIMVTQGYMGRGDCIQPLLSNQVYWFHDIVKQVRVVVEDKQKKYYSIPQGYEKKVVPIYGSGKGSPMTLDKMIEEPNDTKFRFVGKEKHMVYSCADNKRMCDLGTMKIIDRYDERFLVIHHVSTQDVTAVDFEVQSIGNVNLQLAQQFILVPVYMPIHIAVALALDGGADQTFYDKMLDLKKWVDCCDHTYVEKLMQLSNIMTFDEIPPDGEYECVIFLKNRPPESLIVKRAPEYCQISDVNKLEGSCERPVKQAGFKKSKSESDKDSVPEKHVSRLAKLLTSRYEKTTLNIFSRQKRVELQSEQLTTADDIGHLHSYTRKGKIAYGIYPEDVLSKLRTTIRKGSIRPLPEVPKDLLERDIPEPPAFPPPIPCQGTPVSYVNEPGSKPNDDENDPYLLPKFKETGSTKAEDTSLPSRPSTLLMHSKTKQITLPTKQQISIRVDPVLPTGQPPNEKQVANVQGVGPQTPSRSNPPSPTPRKRDFGSRVSKAELVVKPTQRYRPCKERISQLLNLEMPIGSETQVHRLSKGTDVEKVPRDISNFSVEDIVKCLNLLHLSEFEETFRGCQVDGALLLHLNEEILKDQFGLTTFEATKLMFFAKNGWRPKKK